MDKLSCEQNMNKNSNYEQNVNKPLHPILLQFPYTLLFYRVLNCQISRFPHSTSWIKIVPTLPSCTSGIILPDLVVFSTFTADSKRQNSEIAAQVGG